jgi:hypothetical protein
MDEVESRELGGGLRKPFELECWIARKSTDRAGGLGDRGERFSPSGVTFE